jgi:dCMP deaminase
MNWDDYFMSMAELVSTKSKDLSTKIGCVIIGPNHEVRTTGYNGFCRGINDDIVKRPEKYFWTEHAERNAIYNAARNGIRIENCTAYIAGPITPCADCARAMIQSGIINVILEKHMPNQRWEESNKIAFEMFEEAGITVQFL